MASEAAQLLTAPPCPPGVRTVILDGSQVALQVHESCGHPTELDRVFGQEASFAGTSFLTPEKLGTFRYGSEAVTIAADATVPGRAGHLRLRRRRRGGHPHRAGRPGTLHRLPDLPGHGHRAGRRPWPASACLRPGARPLLSNGTARADGWNRIPIVRMTNINLEPGQWALEDLIADTPDGLYMETNRSWSIDDRRLNFQFGTEWCREIKDGRLGQLYRNATYTGITPRFWGGCDAVGRRVAGVGHAQLRQGGADAGGPRGPRRGPRPLPRRPGRGDAVGRPALQPGASGKGTEMYGEETIRRLTSVALEASGGDQTEVLFWGTDQQLTRFANNTIHQNVAEQGAEVSVRVVLGQKVGVASANQLDEASMRDATARAEAVARLQPENPDFAGLPAPTPWERVPSFDAGTAGATPEQRAEGVAAVVEQAREQDALAFGAFRTETMELAVASSRGVWTYFPRTAAELNTVVMAGDASGFSSQLGGRSGAHRPPAVGRAAVDLCARNRDPQDLPPGEYEVLLEPAAVAEMLGFLGFDGFNGLAYLEGRSFLSGKLGETLAGPNVSLWDDGHDRRGLALPFDFEGVAKRRVVLFDRGVASEVVHDTASAAKAGDAQHGPRPAGPQHLRPHPAQPGHGQRGGA